MASPTRTREPSDMAAMKVRAREDLRAQLADAAKVAGRSLNDEIIRRLERSLLSDDMMRSVRETIRQEMRAEFQARREPVSSTPPQAMRHLWSRPSVVSN